MTAKTQRWAGVAAAIASAAAFGALTVWTVGQPDDPYVGGPLPQAGSGSAPVNTSFTEPSVPGMNLGATAATTTTPPSVVANPAKVPAMELGPTAQLVQ